MAISLDGLQALALDLYDHMQRDWAATTYWGGVWVCGFIATFVLLRMLFTHWGDRDVMKKTLGLSVIVHMLFGMLSTTVMFGPGMSSEGEPNAYAIRRVIVENPSSSGGTPGDDARAENEGGSRTGKPRAWEEVPKFSTEPSGRLEQPEREAHAAAMDPQQRTVANEPLAFPAGDLADRPDHADPLPVPDREAARLNRPAERAQPPIAEETAESRPENAKANGPARETRGTAGPAPAAADVARRARPATPSDAPPAVDYGPDLVESAKTPIRGPHDPAHCRNSGTTPPDAQRPRTQQTLSTAAAVTQITHEGPSRGGCRAAGARIGRTAGNSAAAGAGSRNYRTGTARRAGLGGSDSPGATGLTGTSTTGGNAGSGNPGRDRCNSRIGVLPPETLAARAHSSRDSLEEIDGAIGKGG